MTTENQDVREYAKYSDYSVEMHTERKISQSTGKLLRGRALIVPQEARLTFVENEKRTLRSREVARTAHSRLVRRPDGEFTLTFRFNKSGKYLKETLISEIRSQVTAALDDKEVELHPSESKTETPEIQEQLNTKEDGE